MPVSPVMLCRGDPARLRTSSGACPLDWAAALVPAIDRVADAGPWIVDARDSATADGLASNNPKGTLGELGHRRWLDLKASSTSISGKQTRRFATVPYCWNGIGVRLGVQRRSDSTEGALDELLASVWCREVRVPSQP